MPRLVLERWIVIMFVIVKGVARIMVFSHPFASSSAGASCSRVAGLGRWCILAAIVLFGAIAPRADAEVVSIETPDHHVLHPDYLRGETGGAGILFLHMEGGAPEDWGELPKRFNRRGFHTLTLDYRGYGPSAIRQGEDESEAPRKAADMARSDITSAITWMRRKTTLNPNRIILIGAGVGANLALVTAAEDKRIENVVVLSPGLTILGVSAEAAMSAYEGPLLTIVSREDAYAARSALVLDALARGPKYMQIYTGAGHGTAMLAHEPGSEMTILSWLNGTLSADSPGSSQAPPIRERVAPSP